MKVKPILGIAIASVATMVLWLLLRQSPAPFASAGRAVPQPEFVPLPFGEARTPNPKPQVKHAPALAPSLRPAAVALQGWAVTDADVPVPGVWVSAYQPDRGAIHVLADDAGKFFFSELPEGRFRVSAQASGYNETVLDGVPHGSLALRLTMLPLSRVAGRVVRAESGVPIAEFDVLPLQIVPADSRQWQEIARSGGEWQSVSDPAGSFVLPGVPSGKALAVGARAKGFAPAYLELHPLAPGEVSAPVRLALQHGAEVEGRVVDASNRPLEGVAVHLGDSERKPVQDVTDAHGRFRLNDLAPTSILLTASHPDFVDRTVEVSPASPPVDVEIVLAQGAQIEGSVYLAAEPVPGALVVAGALGRSGFQQTARTDAAGKFRLAGLPPGAAEIFVDLPQGDETEEPPTRLQQRVRLEEGAIARTDFRFPGMTGTLEGFIRILGRAPASATLRGTIVGSGGHSFFSAAPAEDGSYRATGLLPGDAWIEVVATTASGAERRRNFALTISEGAAIRRDIALAGNGVLAGRLLGLNEGETGEVEIFPADIAVVAGDTDALSRLQPFRIARVAVQSDGHFRLEGLDPGGYTLLAVVFRPEAEDETDVLSSVRLGSAPVTVRAGETVRVTLRIAK